MAIFQGNILLLRHLRLVVMLKNLVFWFILGCSAGLWSQEIETPYKNRRILAVTDTIQLDSTSVNPDFFKLSDRAGNAIDTSYYKVDYSSARLIFKPDAPFLKDSVDVRFLKLPDYLTRQYSIYDDSKIVSNEIAGSLYQVNRDVRKKFVPFEGLNTSGSITRGITVGNNQNAVTNSTLDLQITGKISEKVSLRASIQDSNIPLQEGGYSQKLDEFDQIFIELFSDKWSIRAGDLFLENRKSRFLNFSKKVQGISAAFELGKPDNKTSIFASAALVRGQYARSQFIGQEGNQGPYKLQGPNGELYILVISGSERVYVNGILLQRGENEDYVIDYNAGEITFTSLFPITSEMRINVEYQFSDRNYTRFVAYAGAMHERKTWSLGGFVYSENDIKNQPLQQNLSEEQAQILVGAGDNPALMTAPSAYADTYSENKILYRKILSNGIEVFEYSNDETETLFNVRFTLVGNNQGNYVLLNSAAIGRIYEYVAPINGVPQGNYEPIVRLVAPTKIQIVTLLGKINPTEKTTVEFEGGFSNNDLNLFSRTNDNDNQGLAGKINARQRIFTSGKSTIEAFANYQFVEKEFRTIERLFSIEFDRDWNLENATNSGFSDQSLLVSGINYNNTDKGNFNYRFEKLDFSNLFSGSRHVSEMQLNFDRFTIRNAGSYLESESNYSRSKFLRDNLQVRYHFGKNWIGSTLRLENNQEKILENQSLSARSQRFTEYGAFIGRGDSTKVHLEIGYLRRANDSLQNEILSRVNVSDSYYLKSKLIQSERRNLSLFVNYRNLQYEDENLQDEPSINSRLVYNDRFFDQFIQLGAAYETTSGRIPQQEFTYLEVEPGQGVYTWNDYNGNGIQELEEFEVAPFPDQALFVRIFLPNQVFLKTHQNKFSTSLTLNPMQWQNSAGFKKFLSYFYNQTSFLSERKIERDGGNFDFNPISRKTDDLLGLNSSFRNSFFYNRGKQRHSTTYTYLSNKTRALLNVGEQENNNKSHQLQYSHLVKKTWLFNLASKTIKSEAYSENYESKNFEIIGYQFAPKIGYLFSKNASWDIFYEYQFKQNEIGVESLNQSRFGTSFNYAGEKKLTASGEFSLYKNDFTGNALSPVAYQLLEGLQPGQNLTWRLLLQKNLTQYLDVNLNYQGRKSQESKAIHTGSIQLRAFF